MALCAKRSDGMEVNMKQKNETNSILERFSKLHEACSRYPTIVLGTVGNKPKIYKEPQGRAKDGFIEKFCK